MTSGRLVTSSESADADSGVSLHSAGRSSPTHGTLPDLMSVRCEEQAPRVTLATDPRHPADAAITGYLAGVFDLFHVGDLDVINQARAWCDRLIVGVSDVLPGGPSRTSREPVVPRDDRKEILRHVRGVSSVTDHTVATYAPEDAERYDVIFVPHDACSSSLGSPGERARVIPLTRRRETASSKLRSALAPAAEATC